MYISPEVNYTNNSALRIQDLGFMICDLHFPKSREKCYAQCPKKAFIVWKEMFYLSICADGLGIVEKTIKFTSSLRQGHYLYFN
jgi:hypothetical protein